MRATCGIFKSRADGERAARKLRSTEVHWDRITLLVSGDIGKEVQRGHRSVAEKPGVCKALGAVTGSAVGIAGGFELGAVASAAAPGIGPVTAVGFWGAVILGLAGAAAGVAAGCALDNALTDGRPEDESVAFDDALQDGLSIVLAFTDDGDTTEFVRHVLAAEGVEGAESIDKARRDWWVGPRRSEPEYYSKRDLSGAGRAYQGEVRAVKGHPGNFVSCESDNSHIVHKE